MATKTSQVLFASAIPGRMDIDCTLPARFVRLLKQLGVADQIKGKTIAIKMHVGGNFGYSTIHPLFVKLLVDHLKAGKPKRVFICLLYTSPSPRDRTRSRMPSSA